MINQIHWLGHGSFCIATSPVIYINPWRIISPPAPADIILISHDHYANFSPADIDKLRQPHTRIISSERVAKEIPGCEPLRVWQSIAFGRTCVKGFPAYHPEHTQASAQNGNLGFVISVDYYDIYYAGETGVIPEMASLHPDIAILPVGDSMTPIEAAQALAMMRPRWAIPCNFEFTNRVNALSLEREAANATEIIIKQPVA
jgi:L-ascorbate metabolism protein UlaG (beta-lactamase superfamily)